MRSLTGLFFKYVAEIPVIAVPNHIAYILHLISFFQKIFGLFDPELRQIFDKGFSYLGLEKNTQVGGTHPGMRSEFREADVLLVMTLYIIKHLQNSPQATLVWLADR